MSARPPFPAVITNSMRSEFAQCPTKCFYSSFEHWKSKRTNIHLHAGGAFAKGVEVARRSFYVDNMSHEDSVQAGWEAVVEFYGQYKPEDVDIKTCERMCSALLYYFTTWPMDQDFITPFRTEHGVRGIEFSAGIPLPVDHPETGEPILYYGRFDMLGQHKNGDLYVVDEKTASQLGNSWVEGWKLDSQFTGYCYLARQFDIPVVGAIIRGISILKHGHGHAQSIQTRPKWMIKEWHQQLVRDVQRMVEAWKCGTWDKSLGPGCKMYGGCGFRDVCASVPENRQNWLDADFHYLPHEPWKQGV